MNKPFTSCIFKSYPEGSVTQWFGENIELYRKYSLSVNPNDNYPLNGHNGIDLVAPWGTPLFAVERGKVVELNESYGYGLHVKLLSDPDENGICHEWVYAHLSKIGVKLGQVIEEGGYLGDMGNTGFVISGSTPYWQYNPYAGTHLHLGLRLFKYSTDTYNIKYQTGDCGYIQNYANGFKGAIDFKDYFPVRAEIIPIEKESQIVGVQLSLISVLNQLVSVYKNLVELLTNKK